MELAILQCSLNAIQTLPCFFLCIGCYTFLCCWVISCFFGHSGFAILHNRQDVIFLVLRAQYFHKCARVLCKVTCFCPVLTSHRKPPSAGWVVPCRQTAEDLMKLAVNFPSCFMCQKTVVDRIVKYNIWLVLPCRMSNTGALWSI
jgi:hypothetical protein